MISIISLSKLIEGGAAMLAQSKRNHHIDRRGAEIRRPLVKGILRV
jgi:hypothetical protein